MSEPSIKKNFAYSTVYQILSLIAPLITAPYLARVLGAENIGIQSYTASIQSYFLLVAALGTQTYGAREISQHRNDLKERSKLFWEIELMTVGTSMLSLIAWIILIAFSDEYRIYFVVMVPYILASAVDITWFFKGLEKFNLTVTRNIFFQILGIVLLFVLVKTKDDLIKYMLLLSGTQLVSSAVLWTYIPKYTIKIDCQNIQILPHLKQTLLYFVPTIATSVYTVLDRTLIGLITQDNAQNGYYEQAEKILMMAKSISFTSINAVVGVRISYLFSENRIEEIHNRIENSMNYIFFMGTGCACGIAAVARNFVPVFFGEGYTNVEYLLYILSPIIVIIGISNCLGSQYYTPSGRRAQSSKYLIVGSCVNLILNLLLINKFAAYGAAIASIAAELVITILYVKNSNDYMTAKLLIKIGWKKVVSGFVMLGVVFVIGQSLPLNKLIVVVIQVISGLAIYIVLLILLKDKWVVTYIHDFVGKIFKKIK